VTLRHLGVAVRETGGMCRVSEPCRAREGIAVMG